MPAMSFHQPPSWTWVVWVLAGLSLVAGILLLIRRRVREHAWVIGLALLGVGLELLYFVLPEPFRDPPLHAASILIELSLAILILNVYVERGTQKRALGAFRILMRRSMGQFLNLASRDGAQAFGKDEFKVLLDKFVNQARDPDGIKNDHCKEVSHIYVTHKPTYGPLLDAIESDLRELAQIIGCAFAPRILARSFLARHAIGELKRVPDGPPSDEWNRELATKFLDAYVEIRDVSELITAVSGGRWEEGDLEE